MQAQTMTGQRLRPRLQRLLKHLWLDHSDVDRLLGAGWAERLALAIEQAEFRGSSELRLCVEAALPWSWLAKALGAGRERTIRERAKAQFKELNVWDTEHNTGVLIYVLLAENAIEIVADRGLQGVAGEQWQAVAHELGERLRGGEGQEAMLVAVEQCSELLAGLNLQLADPGNELPNHPAVR